MTQVSVKINTKKGPVMKGIIVFTSCTKDHIIQDDFSDGIYNNDIEDDRYLVYAWVPENAAISKTYYGNTSVWNGISDPCAGVIWDMSRQFDTLLEQEITIELIECQVTDELGNSSIILNIEDHLSMLSHPIKDVDVSLKRIPPGNHLFKSLDQTGNPGSAYKYENLPKGNYYLALDIPFIPMKNKPHYIINDHTKIEVTFIVKDDGIY
jgi:hypothetical protein